MKIAVYGTLKKGFGNHVLLHNTQFIKNDFVKCYGIHGVGFPIADFTEVKDKSILLEVEIYEVNNSTLAIVDQLEGANQGRDDWYSRVVVTTESGEEVSIYTQKLNSEIFQNIEKLEGDKYTWK